MQLKKWREANKLSSADAAELIGVSPVTLWRWESGRSIPPEREMRAVLNATDGAVTPNDFFGLVESEAEIEAQLMALTVSPERARKILMARAVRAGVAALSEAQATFRHYAEIHAAKPGGLGIKKAEDNAALAGRMGAALALLEGVAS